MENKICIIHQYEIIANREREREREREEGDNGIRKMLGSE